MDAPLKKVDQLTKLLLKGQTLADACKKLGIDESKATGWLEQFAATPNAADVLNESNVLDSIWSVSGRFKRGHS